LYRKNAGKISEFSRYEVSGKSFFVSKNSVASQFNPGQAAMRDNLVRNIPLQANYTKPGKGIPYYGHTLQTGFFPSMHNT
jgi:hypothetical protein